MEDELFIPPGAHLVESPEELERKRYEYYKQMETIAKLRLIQGVSAPNKPREDHLYVPTYDHISPGLNEGETTLVRGNSKDATYNRPTVVDGLENTVGTALLGADLARTGYKVGAYTIPKLIGKAAGKTNWGRALYLNRSMAEATPTFDMSIKPEAFLRVSPQGGYRNLAYNFRDPVLPENRFELVRDIDLETGLPNGLYSIHFKTLGRDALTSKLKDELFKAVADFIPEGGLISTWGSLTKGGKHGVDRFNTLFNWPLIGVRPVTWKRGLNIDGVITQGGEPLLLGILLKPLSLLHTDKAIPNTEEKIIKAWREAAWKNDAEAGNKALLEWWKLKAPDSKIIDSQGNPIKAYHGTGKKFTIFDTEGKYSTLDRGYWGQGAYFSPNKEVADIYANGEIDPMVYKTYLNITNPKELEISDDIIDEVYGKKIIGNDGVIAKLPKELEDPSFNMTEYVATNPNQIKSAEPFTYDDEGKLIDITKRFNFSNPDIRYGYVGVSSLLAPYLNNTESYKKGGSIHIKKKNRGKFTASAKQHGMGVQEYANKVLNDPNATPLQRKRANFARNAKHFKH